MSANSVGFVLGVILVPLVILGGMIFSIIAIIRACTRRTTGWVVAGWFGGAFIVLAGVAAIIGGVVGVVAAQKSLRRGSLSNLAPIPPADNVSAVAGSQTIVGRDVAYSLMLPPDWEVKRQEMDFDLFATHKDIYIGVIPEAVSLGTPEKIAAVARNKLKGAANDLHWSEPLPMQLDGRRWLQWTAQCQIDDIPIAYQFYVYSGDEGSFQVIGWTSQNLFEKDLPEMESIMRTFRFPQAAAAK